MAPSVGYELGVPRQAGTKHCMRTHWCAALQVPALEIYDLQSKTSPSRYLRPKDIGFKEANQGVGAIFH
jgi:hypothetical protein